jgi:hypothetical protein
MTITLELPTELEKGFREAAAKPGSEPSQFVIEALQKKLSEVRLLELQHGYKELGEAQRANPNMYPSAIFDKI